MQGNLQSVKAVMPPLLHLDSLTLARKPHYHNLPDKNGRERWLILELSVSNMRQRVDITLHQI